MTGRCDFCWRPATMLLSAHRRGLWRRLFDLPRKRVRICRDHTEAGIRKVR